MNTPTPPALDAATVEACAKVAEVFAASCVTSLVAPYKAASADADIAMLEDLAAGIRALPAARVDEAMAVELLAQAFERSGEHFSATGVRRGKMAGYSTPLWMDQALSAINAALATPERATPAPIDALTAERDALREALGEVTVRANSLSWDRSTRSAAEYIAEPARAALAPRDGAK